MSIIPKELEISIGDNCFLKCNYCIKFYSTSHLSLSCKDIVSAFELYKQTIISQKETIERIGFVDDPDPLQFWNELKKSILEIRNLSENLKIEVQTSGLFLNNERLKFLLDQNCFVVIRFDGRKKTVDLQKKFRKKMKSSFYLEVLKRLKNINESYLYKVYVAPTFTPETVIYLAEDFKHLWDLGFRKFQYKNMGLCSIWNHKNLSDLSIAIRRFKNEILKKYRNGDKFELFISSFKSSGFFSFSEFIFRPNKKFYVAYSPPYFLKDKMCVGSLKEGIKINRFKEIKENIENFFKKYSNVEPKNIFNPFLLYLSIKLKKMPPAITIISNYKYTITLEKEFGSLFKICKIINKDY